LNHGTWNAIAGHGQTSHIVSERPYRLVFDLPVQATVDYEVETVDGVGNGILTIRAEVRNGQLLVPLEKLERGSELSADKFLKCRSLYHLST
jgi:PII-like signaling protein